MPITLSVHTYRNAAPAQPLSRRFDRLGGALGRAVGNDLVLDDPSKYVSRQHARIEYRDGGYCLIDVGSNPSLVNDRPLGPGHHVRLADGDRIAIGDYQLVVTMDQEESAGLPPSPLAAPMPALGPAPAPAPSFGGMAVNPDDSLADASILNVGGDPFNPSFDPLGLNLLGTPAPRASTTPAYRGAQDDHAPPEQAAFPAQMPAPQPFQVPQPPQPPQPSHMQAPQPAFAPVPPQSLPSAAPQPSAPPSMAIPDDYDPLADFLPPRVQAAPAWTPPAPAAPVPPIPPAPVAPPPLPAAAPAPVAPAAVAPAPVAPAAEQGEATAFVRPAPAPASMPAPAPAAPPPAVAEAPAAQAPQPAPPAFAPPPAPPPPAQTVFAAPAQPAPPPRSTSAADDPVIQALLRGMGLQELNTKRSAEEIAELAGAMLREATSGTMGVLMGRAMTKRESRLEMTMIAVQANNPLKFFPDAHSALTQMMNGTMPGYMAAPRAFANAFDDLKAHELAIMAGMRAALAGVLQRFDPDAIETRLAVPSVMDKVLSSNRKAKMWDRMVELYKELAREADDDFHRLFGEAFGAAYEEQIQRLRQAQR